MMAACQAARSEAEIWTRGSSSTRTVLLCVSEPSASLTLYCPGSTRGPCWRPPPPPGSGGPYRRSQATRLIPGLREHVDGLGDAALSSRDSPDGQRISRIVL